jgi:hypothetical protein
MSNNLNSNNSNSNNSNSNNTNSNNSNSNKLIDNKNCDKNIIKDFWEKKIWEIDYKLINNNKILNIYSQYKKLKDELELDSTKFNFDFNYDIHIIDNKKAIKKKISKFKKDNLNFLKIHADYFYEYHVIISEYILNKNLSWKPNENNNLIYTLVVHISESNSMGTCADMNTGTDKDMTDVPTSSNYKLKNEEIIDKDIQSHYKYFSKCIIKTDNPRKDYFIEFCDWKNELINKLKYNIDKNKNLLIKFINSGSNNNKPFVIIDVENILKSFKIQNFLKSKLTPNEYLKYFNIWLNGDFKVESNDNMDLTNISLSQYSSKIKYIEPFTSLNLTISAKIKLLKIIIENLLNNYNTISIITTNKKKSDDDLSNPELIYDILNEHFFIPIIYKKTDIREQDDHVILYLYTLLKKKNYKVLMLSNDKFKWYSNQDEILTSNFKFLYDFDNLSKQLVIDDAYTPDIYKFNSKYLLFPFINYPIIDCAFFTEKNTSIYNINFDNSNNMNFDDLNSIENQYEIVYNNLIKLSVNDDIKKNNFKYNILTNFLHKYLLHIHKIFTKLFEFLNSYTKKEIFKLSIRDKQNVLSQKQIDIFIFAINKYKSLIEIFQVIKIVEIKFYSGDKNFILFVILFFSIIVEIHDTLQDNLYKIRKLSNSKSNLGELFSVLNVSFIYIRKHGFFKKNIY